MNANYTIEKSLVLAKTYNGCAFANAEYCEDIAIAAGYENDIYVLYRASDFDGNRANAFDSYEYVQHDACPQEIGDGHAGTVTIATIGLDCGKRYIVFENTQTFGREFEANTILVSKENGHENTNHKEDRSNQSRKEERRNYENAK